MAPPTFICVPLPPAPAPRTLPLPGGVSLEAIDLPAIVQPALTPLLPVFNIVDAIVAVFNAIKAIPDMLGPPPDPTVLAPALAELGRKVAVLLGLVPALSIPATVVGLLDLAIATLDTTRTQLLHLQSEHIRMAALVDRAAALNDLHLRDIALCGARHVEEEARSTVANLASLGRVLGLVNLFTSMIGGPTVPPLGSAEGSSVAELFAPIDALTSALIAARSAIPLP